MKVKHKAEDPIYSDRRVSDRPTHGYTNLPERFGKTGEVTRNIEYASGRTEHSYHSSRIERPGWRRDTENRYSNDSRGGEHNEFEYEPLIRS